jgi:branched-chain amino acid transport system substrate-binding protein
MKRSTVALLSALLLASGASLAQAKDFEMAIPLPLTGQNAKFGEIQKKSYEIAAQEINAAGGVKGNKLVLTFEDSQGKPEVSRSIVERLIDVKKQPIIIGEYTSACAKAVAAVAEERKTPYLVVASAADDITQKNYKYVYRMNPTSAYYDGGLISFLNEVVKPKSVAILYESSDFGTAGADNMEKQAKKMGWNVVMKEKYEKGAVDFKPILTQVKSKSPDMIYMISYVMDASMLMKQIKELRIDAKLFAGGAAGFDIPNFIDNAKDAGEFVVTATLWSPQVSYKGAKEYAEKYKAQDKDKDYPSYHGAAAYSALYVFKAAAEKAKDLTPEALREAMKGVDIETAYGPVKFEDKDGYQNQNFMETLVRQVINQQHETIWPKKVASKAFVYPIPKWRERK